MDLDLKKSFISSLTTFFTLACFLFGSFVSFFGSLEIYSMYESESWVSREAIITKSYLSTYYSNSRKSTKAKICVKYIGDNNEICPQISRGFNSNISKKKASENINKYPKGKIIKVYYDPNNPKITLLEINHWSNDIFVVLIGISLLLVGFIMINIKKK